MLPNLIDLQRDNFGIDNDMQALANVHGALHHVNKMMGTENPNGQPAPVVENDEPNPNVQTFTAVCAECDWEGGTYEDVEQAAEEAIRHAPEHPGRLNVVGVRPNPPLESAEESAKVSE